MLTKKSVLRLAIAMAVAIVIDLQIWSQTSDPGSPGTETPSGAVPRLVRFSGDLKDPSGKPASNTASLRFALYKEQEGGEPLWVETQNVQPDGAGHYSVLLGANSPDGLPMEFFTSGEARWLGIAADLQNEQPRVLLVSTPYALKAGDAETLGGKPASAYALASAQKGQPSTENAKPASSTASTAAPAALPPVYGSGTLGSIPMWRGAELIGDSLLSQAAGNIGIGTASPATPLDVNGAATIRGNATVTGTLNLSHTIAAPSAIYNGNNTSQIVNVTQRGTGSGLTATTAGNGFGTSAVSGDATATTGTAKGVEGLSSSDSGVGVEGLAGGFGVGSSIGVNGLSISSAGTGVNGIGFVGVQGSGNGVGGVFRANQPSALVLKGVNSAGADVFSVDPGGNLFAQGGLHSSTVDANGAVISGNAQRAIIGDPGCGGGFAGIGFGALAGCSNYSMIGNGQDTFVNRPAGGAVHFRENNAGSNGAPDQMVITAGGAIGIGTSSPNAQLDVRGGAGTSGFGISTDSNAWQARGASGFIKAMAFIDPFTPGGISVVSCYNSQMTGAAVNTAPCGITIQHVNQGQNLIDFGFQVSDRFVQLTPYFTTSAYFAGGRTSSFAALVCQPMWCEVKVPQTANQLSIETIDSSSTQARALDVPFFVFVY